MSIASSDRSKGIRSAGPARAGSVVSGQQKRTQMALLSGPGLFNGALLLLLALVPPYAVGRSPAPIGAGPSFPLCATRAVVRTDPIAPRPGLPAGLPPDFSNPCLAAFGADPLLHRDALGTRPELPPVVRMPQWFWPAPDSPAWRARMAALGATATSASALLSPPPWRPGLTPLNHTHACADGKEWRVRHPSTQPGSTSLFPTHYKARPASLAFGGLTPTKVFMDHSAAASAAPGEPSGPAIPTSSGAAAPAAPTSTTQARLHTTLCCSATQGLVQRAADGAPTRTPWPGHPVPTAALPSPATPPGMKAITKVVETGLKFEKPAKAPGHGHSHSIQLDGSYLQLATALQGAGSGPLTLHPPGRDGQLSMGRGPSLIHFSATFCEQTLKEMAVKGLAAHGLRDSDVSVDLERGKKGKITRWILA